MFLAHYCGVALVTVFAPQHYEQAMAIWYQSGVALLFEIALIYVPLALGAVDLVRQRTRVADFGAPKPAVLGFAWLALVFVVLYSLDIRLVMLPHQSRGSDLALIFAARYSSTLWGVPWIVLAHLLGLAACSALSAFALNELRTQLTGRVASRLCWWPLVFGFFCFGVGANALILFASGEAPLHVVG